MSLEADSGPKPGSKYPVLPIVAIIALGVGLWLGLQQFENSLRQPMQIQSGTLLPQPRALEPFALTADDGSRFDLESLKGRWTFLSFGYTHCPDACPTTMATFDAIAKGAGEARAKPEFVFVSVDPERDSIDKLGQYVRYFNPDFHGATGPHPALQGLTRQLSVLYGKADEGGSAMGYLVDHSASIMLIDPLGRFAAVFSSPHDPQAMARDYIKISQ